MAQPASKIGTRTWEEEISYLDYLKGHPGANIIYKGFVPNMRVPAIFYGNDYLYNQALAELEDYVRFGNLSGGFLPGFKQLANVASLPGIVKNSIGLPDMHAGYGFAIGNVAAMDMEDPQAVVSPGGVGFDIDCGVRVLRTNLSEKEFMPHQREIADAIFQKVPVGVGAGGAIRVSEADINKALKFGVDWAIEAGYAWQDDKKHCEEEGCMPEADPDCVSSRAKKRGMPQLGSLGAGNHYIEVQSVAKVVDEKAAKMMGIYQGQICVMLHSGSRGLGHQICTDYLKKVENAMSRDGIRVNDRQLACAYLKTNEAQDYLKAMAAGANYAWVNRSGMSSWVREAFADVFKKSAQDLEMHLLYDVCHNMAKKEQHTVNGQKKMLLVHRKGATRAMPRNHPLTPQDYQQCGQPVLVGGTMGSSSYILVGTDENLDYTFGSAVHGAGRSISRNKARRTINSANVFRDLEERGIIANVANPRLVQEEATKSYKPVEQVIQSSIDANLSRTVAQMRPLCVIKG